MHIAVTNLLLVLSILEGSVAFDWTLLGQGNAYTSFISTLAVPPLPSRPAKGDATYFYWPGLQTNSAATNYNPIGFGVLQPVLTFGPACTPNQPVGASPYRGWYVSAQYVNPNGTQPGHKGCMGGNMMDVAAGDSLLMTMVLQGRSGVNSPSGCQVSFSIDMMGQAQNRAELVLELYYQAVVTHDVSFTGISMTILNPEPANSTRFCTPTSRLQKTETCSGMVLSADKKTCTIQQCLFTAPPLPVTPPPASGVISGVDSNGAPISPDSVVVPHVPPPSDPPSSLSGADPNTDDPSSSIDSTTSSEQSSSSSTQTQTGTTVGASGNGSNRGSSGSVAAVPPTNAAGTSATNKTLLFGGIGAAAVVALVAAGIFVYRSKTMGNTVTASESIKIHELAVSSSSANSYNNRAKMYEEGGDHTTKEGDNAPVYIQMNSQVRGETDSLGGSTVVGMRSGGGAGVSSNNRGMQQHQLASSNAAGHVNHVSEIPVVISVNSRVSSSSRRDSLMVGRGANTTPVPVNPGDRRVSRALENSGNRRFSSAPQVSASANSRGGSVDLNPRISSSRNGRGQDQE
ncbi:hypothetical protein BDR26DRAFT_897079 [Obelidium mucronatum]|nr:hypothetical protein BDR26DRAFT_897079 [Obelidium mucronatum]